MYLFCFIGKLNYMRRKMPPHLLLLHLYHSWDQNTSNHAQYFIEQVVLQQLFLIHSVRMYPNISSNNRNNGALGCSRKEATSIVFKDIISIEPLWHGLLNLSWPTQKTSGPLTNVKGIIIFLQRQTPQPFSSLSHRGMNLDGSCFPPCWTPHFKHTVTIGWINLLPAPLEWSNALDSTTPTTAWNQKKCMLTGLWEK